MKPAAQAATWAVGRGSSSRRVFELSYGKPAETPEDIPEDVDAFQVVAMSPAERSQLVRRVLKAYPHLAPLAPVHLFADAGEPEPDDEAR